MPRFGKTTVGSALVAVLAMGIAAASPAATHRVAGAPRPLRPGPGGLCRYGGRCEPNVYDGIQTAIRNVTATGTTIRVCPGIYSGPVVIRPPRRTGCG